MIRQRGAPVLVPDPAVDAPKTPSPEPARSLIERAADVYDFGAHLRGRAPSPVLVAVSEPAAVGPSAAVEINCPEPVGASSGQGGGHLSSHLDQKEGRAGAVDRLSFPQESLRHTKPVETVKNDPLAGVAPTDIDRVQGQIDRDRLAEEGFIVPDAPIGAIAEEFRLVKRQLLLRKDTDASAADQARNRLILVCSAQPNEGKTFCAVNLALSLASERDNEVLLVDADVAKPEVLSTLGLTLDMGPDTGGARGSGLMDAIGDPAIDVESLVIGTNIAKLSVLPAGRATNDDTELLSSARAAALIDGLAAVNPRRIVIIDSAPALAASPAGVLAHYVGRILMIVRADRTSESELRDAVALLDGCPDIALLLNGATFFATNRTYGSYYGAGG